MSPLQILMLLSVHTTGDYRLMGESEGSPAGVQFRENFRKEGLVTGYQKGDTPMVYKLTARGQVFVDAILNLPLPVQKVTWVIPRIEEPK